MENKTGVASGKLTGTKNPQPKKGEGLQLLNGLKSIIFGGKKK